MRNMHRKGVFLNNRLFRTEAATCTYVCTYCMYLDNYNDYSFY